MRSHFQALNAAFKVTPYLVADAATGNVTLATRELAILNASRPKGDFFQSCLVVDIGRALRNFAKLIGRTDQTFDLHELTAIAGAPYTTIDSWINAGVLTCDGHRSTKRDRRVSWRTAFICGMVGNMRRQGLPINTIRRAADTIRAIGVEQPVEAVAAEA
jgi:hypothetical protein